MDKRLTPMHELEEWMNSFSYYPSHEQTLTKISELIEKEKLVIETSYLNGHLHAAQLIRYTGEEYYNEAFLNIKPKDVKAKFTLSGQQTKNINKDESNTRTNS